MLVMGLTALLLAGCAKEKVVAVGNLPPETTVFVKGDLDTVDHTIHIFWFGTDPDGDVRGYEYRFISSSLPGPTPWSFTKHTDSVFAVPSISAYNEALFEIRAIDNSPTPRPADAAPGSPDGQRDDTPDTAFFKVTNIAPSVHFDATTKPTATSETFPAITLNWIGIDPDGDARSMAYQIGLDTIPAALKTVHATSATLDTSQFKVNGVYPPTGPRTAYIRAIDDGGRMSIWDKVTWIVRSPSGLGQHPRLLLIDDVPSGQSPAHDSLYYGAARRNLALGSYALLQLTTSTTIPFRTPEDMAQTFMLFDAVIWYRGQSGFLGSQNHPSTIMHNCQDGMSAYLDRGRTLMLESLYLVEGPGATAGVVGALRNDWVTRYMGSDGLINAPITGRTDSTTDWNVNGGANLTSSIYDQPLIATVSNNGLRGFAVRDTHHVAVWARENELSPPVPRDIPIALSVPVPDNVVGPGRFVVLTFALAGANGLGNTADFLDRIFADMGLDDLGPVPMTASRTASVPPPRRPSASNR
jgi:hypothetical protein